jgi:hypothetical protein
MKALPVKKNKNYSKQVKKVNQDLQDYWICMICICVVSLQMQYK